MGLDVAKEYARINQARKEVEVILEVAKVKLEKNFVIPDTILRLKDVRVACILDEFSFMSFDPECRLLQLTPDGWMSEIDSFAPTILLVESAWKGKDNLWDRMISNPSDTIVSLVKYCNDHEIPTVFWNKEDPAHFNTFISTAKLFNFIFTTDIDSIRKYKNMGKDGSVFLLPFAAQPRIHNPIEKYARKDAFFFAGSYYKRYPERQKDFENAFAVLSPLKPIEIFDRYQGSNLENYQFPEKYGPFIKGSLPPSEIEKAYKGYCYGLNVNSIKQSQTMFARRVFELMVSNTIVISNYSRGLRVFFGDLVVSTDDGKELVNRFKTIADSNDYRDKIRLSSLRTILTQHTYTDRLRYVTQKVFGKTLDSVGPTVTFIATVSSPEQASNVIASFKRQTYTHKRLLLLSDAPLKVEAPSDVHQLTREALLSKDFGADLGEWVAMLSPDDYYGPNYIVDLLSSTKYHDYKIIGKLSRYSMIDDKLEVIDSGNEYTIVSGVPFRSAMVSSDIILDGSKTITFSPDDILVGECFSVDRFNYCRGCVSDECPEVDDLKDIDTGLGMDAINKVSENITKGRSSGTITEVGGNELLSMVPTSKSGAVTIFPNVDGTMAVISHLPEDKNEYLYFRKMYKASSLDPADHVRFFLDADPGLNLSLVLVFYDSIGNKLGHTIIRQGRVADMDVPQGAANMQFAIRIQGSGSATIRGMVYGDIDQSRGCHLPKGDVLALVNQYPEYSDLYRNAFIHSRVKAYKERGTNVDVVKIGPRFFKGFYEFNGVDVTTGENYTELHTMMSNGDYKAILVHFLNRQGWSVLKEYADKIPVIVWIHGFEIQPYYRREYNFKNDEERERAIKASDDRSAFWRDLFKSRNENVHFVFVSQYFADEVMGDLEVKLDAWQYSIIHNFVDTDVFKYTPRDESDRLKLLSIRSFASPKYANDLTVKALLALSTRPFFKELNIRIVGDGVLFDQTVEALRKFPNITLEKGFLSVSEYQKIFKNYGVFLTPTRWDSQGVSRDEAMSSGLVAISNRIAGVPEFVDDTCGILVDPEDYIGMANAIERLYKEPDRYLRLSFAAASRVRRQNGLKNTILRELMLIRELMNAK